MNSEADLAGVAGSGAHSGRLGNSYTGGVGSRREARERALELLYEAETKSVTTDELLSVLPIRPGQFTVELIEGVHHSGDEFDRLIAEYSHGWSLDRMPILDRIVLRLAIFELTQRPDIPTASIINEAVELAKRFSTADSGKFVNGVLSTVASHVRGI